MKKYLIALAVILLAALEVSAPPPGSGGPSGINTYAPPVQLPNVYFSSAYSSTSMVEPMVTSQHAAASGGDRAISLVRN